MVWGVLERNINYIKAASAKNKYRISPDMIVDFVLEAQRGHMDAHIIAGGQNGLGKSYLLLGVAKRFLQRMNYNADFATASKEGHLEFFFAHHSREQLKEAIKTRKGCVFVIDELRPFFDYKRSMTKVQTSLYNTVEIARSNSNVYIGASRDYTKLDINYRNAKAQMLLYLFDKVVDSQRLDADGFYTTKFTYGAVFAGNPSLEYEDKFMFSQLRGYSLETTKYLAEKLRTWIGNIVVENVEKYGVSPSDISFYNEQKEKGIQEFEKEYKQSRMTAKDEDDDETSINMGV